MVERENRCSPYDRKRDYRYSPKIEEQIVSDMGAIYGPYTKTYFTSAKQTDIEHIVVASEAHDSGLCFAGREMRLAFARDLRNLTLASAKVNRHIKKGHDASQWVLDHNKC